VPGPAHLDFDVLFSRDGDGFRAQVLRSPAGEGQSVTFSPPFTDLELENFILKVARFTGRTRRVEAAPVAAAKQAGGRLFEAVFSGAVGECMRRSVDHAEGVPAALRIRLRLADVPELAGLPWELLYDRSDDWFLALSDSTPVVRYVQLPARPRPVEITLPLRVLVIRSEPHDYPALNLDAEWAQVSEALAELTSTGLLAITELAAPTLSELRRALLRDTYHVLHYMGHGGFDQEHGGTLLFTDRAGRGVPVTGSDLGVMLRDHTSMRLAVLNACQAGRTDPEDPFAGVSDTLVRRGIPAVIAMQFEITDAAAVEFAPALYGAIAAGYPIDAAVAEARKAIYTVSPLEWATPVLYLRGDDARLFDVSRASRPESGRPREDTPAGARPSRARPAAAQANPLESQLPGGEDPARLLAAMRRFNVPAQQGLNREQASRAFSENGYDPRSFGGWVRRGWIARDGDRRYLTDQGRQWVEAQETGGTENWRLILAAARALTAAGQTPFTRQQVYEWIWERHQRSDHERPSLDPTFQGMISNATGGPASAGGTPLQRIRRGLYVLAEPSGAAR
jgi:hypothetical protein